MFRHPKYYKELRKRNKETQQEPQRILDKPGRSVSNSDQVISLRTHDGECERAPGQGLKQQASSKPEPVQVQASSNKRQAWNPEAQASSVKPQAASSVIRVPRYKNTEEVFLVKDQGSLPW